MLMDDYSYHDSNEMMFVSRFCAIWSSRVVALHFNDDAMRSALLCLPPERVLISCRRKDGCKCFLMLMLVLVLRVLVLQYYKQHIVLICFFRGRWYFLCGRFTSGVLCSRGIFDLYVLAIIAVVSMFFFRLGVALLLL